MMEVKVTIGKHYHRSLDSFWREKSILHKGHSGVVVPGEKHWLEGCLRIAISEPLDDMPFEYHCPQSVKLVPYA